MTVLFAVCAGDGDGGSDAAAIAVVLVASAAYLALTAWLIRGAESGTRTGLAGIFAIAALIGAAFVIGSRYDEAFFRYVLLGTAIAVLVGGLLARAMPRVGSGRALTVSLAGALMLPVLGLVLILSAFLVGTACLE